MQEPARAHQRESARGWPVPGCPAPGSTGRKILCVFVEYMVFLCHPELLGQGMRATSHVSSAESVVLLGSTVAFACCAFYSDRRPAALGSLVQRPLSPANDDWATKHL